MDKKIEKILNDFDKGNDQGKTYKTYYKDVYEEYIEPNTFDAG